MSDLDHIERPTAPWRTERLTECGLDDQRAERTAKRYPRRTL